MNTSGHFCEQPSSQNRLEESPNETLFRTLLNDPSKRALMLKILSVDQINSTPLRSSSSQITVHSDIRDKTNCNIPSSLPNPSNGILKDVIAFVDLRSKEGCDRSSGAKALMRCLGASVRDTFTADVTHVIFKDGSFDTYLRAKQFKVHLVSILWVEAVRNRNCHISEKDYPALNTSTYDANVTEMCKDYEDLVQDEQLIAASQHANSRNRLNTLPLELRSPTSSNTLATTELLSGGEDCDVVSISSEILVISPGCHSNRWSDTPELTSDNDSDCGVINGHPSKRNNNSFDCLNNDSNRNIDKIITESSSSMSVSLLATVNRTSNNCVDMDLTGFEDKENTPELQSQKSKTTSKYFGTAGLKEKSLEKNMFKSSSECAFIRKKASKDSNRSESCPSLRISDHSITGSSSRNFNYNIDVDNKRKREIARSLTTNNVKKRKLNNDAITSLKALQIVTPNTSKTNSANETLPSLRISTSSENITPTERNVNSENSELDKRGVVNPSFIARLSRMAIRGSGDTVNKSNDSLKSKTVSKDAFQDSPSNISSLSSDKTDEHDETQTNDNEPETPKTAPQQIMRKLYNPNQTIDEAHNMWVEEENRKAYNVPNKQLVVSLVPIPQILVTQRAKKLLKFLGNNNTDNPNNDTQQTQNEKSKVQKKKQRKKVAKKKVTNRKLASDDENDAQTSLLNEIIKHKRHSIRVSQQNANTPIKRRSTNDFVAVPRPKVHNLFTQSKRKIKPRIVCTRFHKPEVIIFIQIVKKLEVFVAEDEVSRKTTHLVVGECRRTINLLRALARGCWIVKKEWLYLSLEAEEWLPEEDFELTEFSPAVQQCRLHRQAFGRQFSIDIFQNCGPIYIVRSSNPRRSDLEELVLLCKGRLSNSAQNATIIVGERVRFDVTCVSEQWILDSITCNKRKSFRRYLLW